ncbi:MAG: MerR family transcriptional regulator [Acidobacteriota bacterium]
MKALPSDPRPEQSNVISADIESRKYLRIGDLARMTGKSTRAIHLYEELGLIAPVSRTKGGFRLFSPRSAVRLQWIGLLNTMGFSLHQIKDFVDELEHTGTGPAAMAKLRDIFNDKLRETRDHLDRLQNLERELVAGIEYLEECGTCSNPETLFHVCAGCPYPIT